MPEKPKKKENDFQLVIVNEADNTDFMYGHCDSLSTLILTFQGIKNKLLQLKEPLDIQFLIVVPKEVYHKMAKENKANQQNRLIAQIEAGLKNSVN